MNVYIMTDLEGISGIYAKAEVGANEAKYSDGRTYTVTADGVEEAFLGGL